MFYVESLSFIDTIFKKFYFIKLSSLVCHLNVHTLRCTLPLILCMEQCFLGCYSPESTKNNQAHTGGPTFPQIIVRKQIKLLRPDVQ